MIAPETAFDRLCAALRRAGKVVRTNRPGQVMAQCPAHDDQRPSLSVKAIEGQVLLYCFANCHVDDVLARLGLTTRDLFDDREGVTYAYDDGRKVHRSWDKRFRQSGTTNGHRTTLYRATKVAAANKAGETIYVAEGEKDVHALESLGVTATTAPMGAANWSKVDPWPLYGAAKVVAIVHRDEAGQKWAAAVREMFTGHVDQLDFRQAKTGNDAADHIAAGHTLDELEPVPDLGPLELAPNVVSAIGQVFAGVTVDSAARANGCTIAELTAALRVSGAREIEPTSEWDSVDLLGAEFREAPDILDGVVPVGVALLSAAPNVGKTRLLTQLSVAAVRGAPILGRQTTKTRVLTLALEDGARRYRKALTEQVGTSWPNRGQLTIRTTSKRLNEGGLVEIERHLDRHAECGLVIIDVLERVRPRSTGTNAYRLDYEALAPLQRMANVRQIAIVVVHHTNQRADVADIFEKVSGTSGLTGVVDSLLLLQRRRGDSVGGLSVSGREVEDKELALSFTDGWWGPAPEGMPAALLDEKREIRELWLWLAEHDGASTPELSERYGRTENATLKVLKRLEERELIDSLGTPAKGRPVCWQVVRNVS